MGKIWRDCAAIFFTLACVGCGGPVLQTEPQTDLGRIEGGFLEYFFPRGEVTVTADYTAKSGQLIMQIEPKIMPDFAARHRIYYTHAGISKDAVSIQLENNGLLKLVSSTTTDQTLQLAQGINAILAQFQATQAAAEAAHLTDAGAAPGAKSYTVPPCDYDVKSIKVVDITNRVVLRKPVATFAPCKIEIKVTPRIKDLHALKTLNAKFSPKPGESLGKPLCEEVICFRLAGAYHIDVTACLTANGTPVRAAGSKEEVCVSSTAEFLAPTYRTGFIRFNRRAFVENTTKATFNNGLLTGIESTDPNELVGFLSIPSEILKGFAILITL
jgi:hypothetical protein